jgi:hypothetical protein
MTENYVGERYRGYLACLNEKRFGDLAEFVHDSVVHHDRTLTVVEFQDLLRRDAEEIPDLLLRDRAAECGGRAGGVPHPVRLHSGNERPRRAFRRPTDLVRRARVLPVLGRTNRADLVVDRYGRDP